MFLLDGSEQKNWYWSQQTKNEGKFRDKSIGQIKFVANGMERIGTQKEIVRELDFLK